MGVNRRYPKIGIRSKNELAKRISNKKLTQLDALRLINDVLENKDIYWKDSKKSDPEAEKWVRNASFSKYGELLNLINTRVLAKYDKLIPNFIFGGIIGKNHKMAAKNLIGNKRQRVLLKLDLKRFFEQNNYDRVYSFFLHKCDCSKVGAKLLADLCCVPFGPKDDPQDFQTIARGFSTSPRLAVWCNLDVFIKLESTAKRYLKGRDPQISVYVDDIGITASRVDTPVMIKLYDKLVDVIASDKHHPLTVNEKKTRIIQHSGDTYDIAGNLLGKWSFEFVGIQLKRNSLTIGFKTKRKLRNMRQNKVKGKKKKSLWSYKTYVEK